VRGLNLHDSWTSASEWRRNDGQTPTRRDSHRPVTTDGGGRAGDSAAGLTLSISSLRTRPSLEEPPIFIGWRRNTSVVLPHCRAWTLVPLRWLHLTMQNVGFTDEVSDAECEAVVDTARVPCSELAPFDLKFDGEKHDRPSWQLDPPPVPGSRRNGVGSFFTAEAGLRELETVLDSRRSRRRSDHEGERALQGGAAAQVTKVAPGEGRRTRRCRRRPAAANHMDTNSSRGRLHPFLAR
jgi:hypothetical protein